MSRKFNGTTNWASANPDLSAFSTITVSYWLWWDTNANDDDFACEMGGASFLVGSGFVVDHNSSSAGGGKVEFGMGLAAGSARWTDTFTRPSAAAWHHYMFTFDRATPQNQAWVDGAAQTLATLTHNAGTYGTFGNAALTLMSRNGGSLFGAGRMAEWTIWGGVKLGQRQATALAGGAPPETVWPANIVFRAPLWGADSTEPDYSGRRKSVTISGATFAAHPPVPPGLNRSIRTYQAVPA